MESVAYFVVSEALTNVTKHARATRVDVTVRADRGDLRVVVTDDGIGGADPPPAPDCAGSPTGRFRRRHLPLSSPAGGPTTIAVELPCAP